MAIDSLVEGINARFHPKNAVFGGSAARFVSNRTTITRLPVEAGVSGRIAAKI